MIAIIDYGMGNIRSVTKATELYSKEVIVTNDPQTIKNSSAIILPGVGAFAAATKNLEPIKELLLGEIAKGKPFLGICLGLQLLFDKSTELGGATGFELIPGDITSFKDNHNFAKKNLSLPQIGWNSVTQTNNSPLFKDLPDSFDVYFVHSFYAPLGDTTIGKTNYGVEYSSALQKDNLFAVQFHPEKSSNIGLKILGNFMKISS